MDKYNLAHEEGKRFEIYTGRNTEAMPKLIADGRVPMNVSQLMQRRLGLRNDTSGVKDFFMNNYFDTGDAVVYNPDGEVKIVYDAQQLREMNPQSERNGGALVLGADVYKALQGEKFKKGELGKTDTRMSKEDVKAHPVWKALARGDQALLNDYTDFMFAEGKYGTAMGIFPGSCGGSAPEMRTWCVDGLGNRSDVDGWSGVDDDYGRLVGIAPVAQGLSGIPAVQNYTIADLQAYDNVVKGLEGTLHPDVLKQLAGLRKKL